MMWAAGLVAFLLMQNNAEYRASVERWREQREQRLRAEDGWLTLTGLFWLEPGPNTVGSAAGSDVQLPAGAAPEKVGIITLEGDRVRLEVAGGVRVLLNGQPVRSAELRSDATGQPDTLSVGRLTLLLLKRGPRYAIRVKDPDSPYRREFKGLKWYPVDERWRITGRFLPYPSPRKVVLDTVAGVPEEMESPGQVEFLWQGVTYRLEAFRSGKQLFFVFRDATSGKTTYSAGRFLYADLPVEGKVVLDFNKAYNPPCAFTPYATCPLPPRQNRLSLAITAGEMKYEGQAH